MIPEAGNAFLHVTVVYSAAPRHAVEIAMELPPGATVQQAVASSGLAATFVQTDFSKASIGVWGRKAAWQQVLREADRVEIYRPLVVDPKIARRERFATQGARTTGLFAKKRAGAKAGY